jgi:hypothetical protein
MPSLDKLSAAAMLASYTIGASSIVINWALGETSDGYAVLIVVECLLFWAADYAVELTRKDKL